MFYKFATAFACFFVLGQAMADENIAGKGKGMAEEQGPIGAEETKGMAEEQGPLGPEQGAAEEQGPLGPEEGAAEEQGPLGPEPGKGVAEEQGPAGAIEGKGPAEEQGPAGAIEGKGVSEEQGPAGPKGIPEEPGPAGPENVAFPVRTATWDDLKLACVEPNRFHFQLPPGGIQIRCASQQTDWEPIEDGLINGDRSQLVVAGLLSDKLVISDEQYNDAVPPSSLRCLRYREVTKSYRTNPFALTCDEILQYNTLKEFCVEKVITDAAVNAELVEVQATGRVVDTCGAPANVGITK